MKKQEFETLCNGAFEDLRSIQENIEQSTTKTNVEHILVQLADFKKFAMDELFNEEIK